MKTKKEIITELAVASEGSEKLTFWLLVLELLADIRDEQIAHNNENGENRKLKSRWIK